MAVREPGVRRACLSQRHPALLPVAVAGHRARRRLTWLHHAASFAGRDDSVATPFVVTRHGSVLMRRLGSVDMRLQRNKVVNLRLAASRVSGRVLEPGQTLSVWRCIGNPTSRRGYLPGLQLGNDGRVIEGVGGGLCQLSNLLHWMVLHTPLEVSERHHHGFDVFPDSGRVLPFGTGAGIFYNYVDFAFSNPTPDAYRVLVWVTERELRGEIRAARMPEHAYHVDEVDHRFVRVDGVVRRQNTLIRRVVERRTGNLVRSETLGVNDVPVLYEVDPALVAQT